MSETPANRLSDMWSRERAFYVEKFAMILLAIASMSLQYGKLDSTILLSPQLGIKPFFTLKSSEPKKNRSSIYGGEKWLNPDIVLIL